MAFITSRAGRASGSIQSVLRRNFQPLFSAHKCQQQQNRSFTQRQLSRIGDQKIQIYKSTSSDPYVNLSIEHYLLENSHPNSTVLFLYKNRPCVVIGRNQNPWVEVNLGLCQKGITPPSQKPNEAAEPQKVDIVRRRSGGGTVFHDEGNVNWTVICPKKGFNRDKHAEMVVRALKTLDIKGAPRVNERHDIVLDVKDSTYKISGSAYKMVLNRALHHGTCLLESPYLKSISKLLSSPAVPYISARGTESVRSPVCNVGIGTEEFISAVVDEFRDMYNSENDRLSEDDMLVHEESALQVKGIKSGLAELKSDEWIYGQTPRFTFSTHPIEKHRAPPPPDPRPRPPLPEHLPPQLDLSFSFEHGKCTQAGCFHPYRDQHAVDIMGTNTVDNILGAKFYEFRTWEDIIGESWHDSSHGTPESRATDRRNIALWLDTIMPPKAGAT